MIDVLPTTQDHLSEIDPKECHKNELGPIVLNSSHTPMSLFVDGKLCAIFGGFFITSGVFQLWGIVDKNSSDMPVSFCKGVECMLNVLIETYKARRIQMSVRCDYTEGSRFARFLGFKSEGIMEQYGTDGSDYYLLARCV